jgi:hypothetical protein
MLADKYFDKSFAVERNAPAPAITSGILGVSISDPFRYPIGNLCLI